MTDPIDQGIDQGIDPGYGVDARLSADPDSGRIAVSTLTLGDGGGRPFDLSFDPSTPIGEVMDALMQARGATGV